MVPHDAAQGVENGRAIEVGERSKEEELGEFTEWQAGKF
jgi:hypothetical protein